VFLVSEPVLLDVISIATAKKRYSLDSVISGALHVAVLASVVPTVRFAVVASVRIVEPPVMSVGLAPVALVERNTLSRKR
jgi:hypothetical protein